MTGVRSIFSHCIFLYPPHPATPSPSKQREKLQSMRSMSSVCLHIKQSDSVLCGGGDLTAEWILFLHHPLNKESKVRGTVVYKDI